MDRRSSLKAIALGAASTSLLLEACKQEPGKTTEATAASGFDAAVTAWDKDSGRQPFEIARDKKIMGEKFFTDHEMKTIAILADIIIPADNKSGSATDAGVPDFIEFIVNDMPEHQTPMRGGIRWLDLQCLNKYDSDFAGCSNSQQMEMVDEIAWPEKATPEMEQGVAFFNLMRNLTATGFFSSKIGIADIGYMGNTPNIWDGVPDDVLKQYGVAYDEKTLQECVKKEDHDKIMTWD
jgi:Gluconate 2-dehydrogenase subunit 3